MRKNKNIVLCSDGTGNRDIKNRGTNVFKIYEAVDTQGHKTADVKKQVAFYDDGVGTANAFAKIVGGAFGWGFSTNVKKLYRELVNVYEEGDSIYLFGFSRGAYTARALAGFIQYLGVLDINYYTGRPRNELSSVIHQQWDQYTRVAFKHATAKERRSKIPEAAEAERQRQARIERRNLYKAVDPNNPVNIAFIGVWDTVGAIGTPFDGMRDFIARFHPIWFADNTLGPEVRKARHALALDEERRTFHPELWNEQDGDDKRIKQVWFPGVHSNVGGGYPKQGMSLVTLDWMMNEAKEAELRFMDSDLFFAHEHQDVHDKLYDSRSDIKVYYRWSPRDIAQLCNEHRIPVPKVHVSVFERIGNGTVGMDGANSYSPGNLPFNFEVDTSGSIGLWPKGPFTKEIKPLMGTGAKRGEKDSLMADMSKTVASGKLSYYSFLALTAVTAGFLGMMARREEDYFSGRKGGRSNRKRREKDGSRWESVMTGAAVLGLGAAGIYRWSQQVDGDLCRRYTEFWHSIRKPLRDLLDWAEVETEKQQTEGGKGEQRPD